jgi:hypothetical protein
VQIDGVGEVLQWGEWWLLVYSACRHETMFSRTGDSLFEPDEVQAAVLEHYAECTRCHPPRRVV